MSASRVSLPGAMTDSATPRASASRATSSPRFVIRQRRGFILPDLRELWHYREIVYFLSWRDVKVRYAQTMLGAAWTLLQPLALMLLFTYAFSRVGSVKTGSVPYPLFALAGVAFWTFFARAVTGGSESLVQNAALLTKVYCPRILIPISTIMAALADLTLSLVLLIGVAAVYDYYPTWRLVLLPAAVLLGVLLIAGVTFLFSAINVRFRDIGQALPFLVLSWLFLSPVAYPVQNRVFELNPLAGVIDAFRWCVLGTPVTASSLLLAGSITVGLLVVGTGYFVRAERTFADIA
ncbi:MAG: phosphate ABC transporter permease [Gemmatimonadetes bacterium]|nr:MAG: phosphate ABC transporter permease [Gemmatimonadota bacterium]TML60589.1 MAG: ABC transporter permease [Actinomycetota bacterium]